METRRKYISKSPISDTRKGASQPCKRVCTPLEHQQQPPPSHPRSHRRPLSSDSLPRRHVREPEHHARRRGSSLGRYRQKFGCLSRKPELADRFSCLWIFVPIAPNCGSRQRSSQLPGTFYRCENTRAGNGPGWCNEIGWWAFVQRGSGDQGAYPRSH